MAEPVLFTKILVPLDGADLGESILPYVTQLVHGLDSPHATLLTVRDPDAVWDGKASERGIDTAIDKAQRKLDTLVKDLAVQGISAESQVATGRPTDEILKAIESGGFTLVAMATHGRSALGRGVMGSVTDGIIHRSSLPTLVLRPKALGEYENVAAILVPLDGSPLAETVLPFVEELAVRLSLPVSLLRVASMPSAAEPYSAALLAASHLDVDEQVEHEAVSYLQDIATQLSAKGLTVEWHVYHGAPIRTIDQVAKETPNTLVALTTHGRSGIKRLVIGSVADAVIRDSGHPVLVVPPRGDE